MSFGGRATVTSSRVLEPLESRFFWNVHVRQAIVNRAPNPQGSVTSVFVPTSPGLPFRLRHCRHQNGEDEFTKPVDESRYKCRISRISSSVSRRICDPLHRRCPSHLDCDTYRLIQIERFACKGLHPALVCPKINLRLKESPIRLSACSGSSVC